MGPELTSQPFAESRAGFTLIELLVTVAVLAVLSVGVVLATGRGGPADGSDADQRHFEDSFTLMRALAIEGRAIRGLKIAPDGLRRAERNPGGWQVAQPSRAWSGKVGFAPAQGAIVSGGPDILFLPNGRTSAFSMAFEGGARCETDGWTGLICRAR